MSIFKLPALVPMLMTALVFEMFKVIAIILALIAYLLDSDFFTRNLASLFVDTEEVIVFCVLFFIVLNIGALIVFIGWFKIVGFKGWDVTIIWALLGFVLPFMIMCWIAHTAVVTVARDAKKIAGISQGPRTKSRKRQKGRVTRHPKGGLTALK